METPTKLTSHMSSTGRTRRKKRPSPGSAHKPRLPSSAHNVSSHNVSKTHGYTHDVYLDILENESKAPGRPSIKDNPKRRPRPWVQRTCTLMIMGAWLVVLTVLLGVVWHRASSPSPNAPTASSPAPDARQLHTHEPNASSENGVSGETLIHSYPFNIYSNTPGQSIRYPSATQSGIPNMHWSLLTWYKVCCKHENAMQCFSPEWATLSHEPAHDYVYLTLQSHPMPTGANVGQIGSRCHVYWSERMDHDNLHDA